MMADVRTGVPGVVGKIKKSKDSMKKIKDSVDQQELVSLLEQEGLEFVQEELDGCTVVDVVLPHEDAYLSFIYSDTGDLMDVTASYAELVFGVQSFDIDLDGESGLIHKLATVESEAFVDALRELGFVTLQERGTITEEAPEGVVDEADAVAAALPPEAGVAFRKACVDFVDEWLSMRESDGQKVELYDAVESVVSLYSLDDEVFTSSDAGMEAFDILVQVAPDGFKVVLEELKRAAEAGDVSAYEGVLTDLMIQAMNYEVPAAAAEVADSDAPRRDFIFPADSTMVDDGKGHFPINTLSRGRYALSAVAKYDKLPEWYAGDMDLEEFKSHVQSEVSKAWPSIEVSDSVKAQDSADGLIGFDELVSLLEQEGLSVDYSGDGVDVTVSVMLNDDTWFTAVFDFKTHAFIGFASVSLGDKYYDVPSSLLEVSNAPTFFKALCLFDGDADSFAQQYGLEFVEDISTPVSDAAPEFKVGDRVKLDTEEAQKRSKAYYDKEGEVTSVSDFVLGVKFDDGTEVPVPTNFATLVAV